MSEKCNCICIPIEPVLVIGGMILLCTLGILFIMSNNGDNLFTWGMSQLTYGEIYYIQHPTELPLSPAFWIIIIMIGMWKRAEIIGLFVDLYDKINQRKDTSEIQFRQDVS